MSSRRPVLLWRFTMAKEALIEADGAVLELLPDARFRVRPDNERESLAYASGKMRKARIR